MTALPTRHVTQEPAPRRRAASLRRILTWLVLACVTPGMLAAAAVLFVSYRSERAQIERGTILTVRAIGGAVDGELMKAEAAAQALATSPHLARRDFGAFHRQASELLNTAALGSNFVLSDADGQQLVNTVRPYPGPLPRHGNPDQLRRVFETGRPVMSDIYLGGVLRRPVMSIDVPVRVDGRVAYDLSIGLFPERLGEVLRAQQLPDGWVAAVFDSQGVIVARTHAPERYVGRKGAPALVQRMAQEREGMVETATLEGIAVAAVFSRSAVSNWTVAIGIPIAALAAELRSRVAMLAVTVALLLILAVAVAWFLSERIAMSIRSLVEPALALGSGAAVAVPPVRLREAEEVAAAIGTAASLLKRRTEELETANRELQEFSYSVSHDLRTPLRAIAGFAQIVAEEHGDRLDDEGRLLLARVRVNTVRIGRVIDGLTDFMQISRAALNPECVDMAALATEIFDKLRAQSPERRLQLRLGALPPAWGDRRLLQQALEHLIGNAMKFIPAEADGVITVGGETDGDEIVYHVADNGVGFDMRFAAKLFRVFERVHAPGQFEGIGIGLAIVKRIVGRHGGRVWAEGKVGAGATFHFALPAAPAGA